MCGIAGLVDLTTRSSRAVLTNMTSVLSHRGPDGEGYFFSEEPGYQVGLGHRRLAVIDLSESGKQPMSYNDLAITFNGEIYNYEVIRDELVKLGHSFHSNSDTEVILHSYKEWGSKCLEKFTGMFAFVIYDAHKKQLFCARDRAGVKPFFYYWKDGLFLFASELKSFHQHPLFKKELNLESVLAFVQFGNIPSPYCIFQNCQKLKPGHFLYLTPEQAKIETVQYWNVYDYYNKPKLDISFNEAKKHTEELLISAANLRMVADVPVGVFLSGGYDSSCLTALLQKNRPEKLKTFTIGVKDSRLNEAPYAKKIAAFLGTNHTEYYCSENDARNIVPQLPGFFDEPFGDHSAIPTLLVSRIARQQVTVALSADGGDECFAGYNRYGYLMKEARMLKRLPPPLRAALSALMRSVPPSRIPLLRNKFNFSNRYNKLQSLLDDPSVTNVMLRLTKQYTNEEARQVLASPVAEYSTAYLSEELGKESFTPLSYMMAIDYQTYLPDDILQKVDRASMSQSLEAREPWLDQHIIEFVAQLPDAFKYYKHEKKYILKEITHSYIPKELLQRPKMGFAVPVNNWLYSDLREQVTAYLNHERIRRQGIFNPLFTDKILHEFYSGKTEAGLKLWYFYMFQLWYERWMT